MSEVNRQTSILIEKYLESQLTDAERDELCQALRESQAARECLEDQLDISLLLAEEFEARDFVAETAERARHELGSRAPIPIRQKRPMWKAILAVAAAIAVVSGLLLLTITKSGPQRPLQVVSVDQATVLRNGSEEELVAGATLRNLDLVKGRVQLRYVAEDTSLSLSAKGQLRIQSLTGAKSFKLEAGELVTTVARQSQPMTLVTPHAQVTVLGTSFSVDVRPGKTKVAVEEGRVRVDASRSDSHVILEAKQSATYGRDIRVSTERVFDVVNGTAVMEAEHYSSKKSGFADTINMGHDGPKIDPRKQLLEWTPQTAPSNFSGRSAMKASTVYDLACNNSTNGPHLQYSVRFQQPGTYYVWLKLSSQGSRSNSIHIGLNGKVLQLENAGMISMKSRDRWKWANAWQMPDKQKKSQRATIRIEKPGIHTFDIWMRESNILLDKILLTQSAGLRPKSKTHDETLLR